MYCWLCRTVLRSLLSCASQASRPPSNVAHRCVLAAEQPQESLASTYLAVEGGRPFRAAARRASSPDAIMVPKPDDEKVLLLFGARWLGLCA